MILSICATQNSHSLGVNLYCFDWSKQQQLCSCVVFQSLVPIQNTKETLILQNLFRLSCLLITLLRSGIRNSKYLFRGKFTDHMSYLVDQMTQKKFRFLQV